MMLRFVPALCALLIAGCSGGGPKGKIVFQSSRDGNFEIYTMKDDGTDLQRLTNSPSYDVSPSWSPDGSRILFASDRNGNWDIFTMSSAGNDVQCLTSRPGSHTSPSWAKEGTAILFVSTRDVLNGELYIMNADGSSVERLTQDSTVKDSPVMTRGGESVVFVINDRMGYLVASLRLSDRTISGLTPASLNATWPRVLPDGSLVLFSSTRNGYAGIFSMTPTGENVKSLTPSSEDSRMPAWGWSERDIIYSKNGGLYSRSLDTGKETILSNKGDSAPHWVAN